METDKKIFIHSDEMDKFPYPPTCPFNTSRAGKVKQTLDSMGLLSGDDREVVAPQIADTQLLEKFHSPEYILTLQEANKGEFAFSMLEMGLGTGDCPVFRGVYDNSKWAVGATVTAANMILSENARVAFNPSGGLHHAHTASASGFCYLNDVVLGCMMLTDAGRKVLFLDVDVHHTDGVQEAFYDTNEVMTISLHQDGRTIFPGTGFPDEIGTGIGKGYSVNLPMPPGAYDEIYMKAVESIVYPLIEAYNPDIIVTEIGADGLAGDPLAALLLTNNVYADIISKLLTYGKPILATGGGGYNIENTVRAWALVWRTLCGDDTEGHDAMGMGGVMLESTDWHGGLRDRVIPPDNEKREMVDMIVDNTIELVKTYIFPHHGL